MFVPMTANHRQRTEERPDRERDNDHAQVTARSNGHNNESEHTEIMRAIGVRCGKPKLAHRELQRVAEGLARVAGLSTYTREEKRRRCVLVEWLRLNQEVLMRVLPMLQLPDFLPDETRSHEFVDDLDHETYSIWD
jgi:hypothetical protein